MLVGAREHLNRANLDLPELEITTFAQPGNGPEEVLFDQSVITADCADLRTFLDKMGTPHSLDLNAFDMVILATKTATAFNMFGLLKGYRVSDWASSAGFRQTIRAPGEDLDAERLISSAAVQACLINAIQSNLSYRLCAQIRRGCDVPIYIVRNPLLAEKTLEHRPKLNGLRRILARGDGDALRACIDAAHIAAFDGLTGVRVIMQPKDTITEGCLTKEAYGRDSVRLASTKPHFDTDILHAGPKLGALLLQDILRRHGGA